MEKEKGRTGVFIESDCQDTMDLIKTEVEEAIHSCRNHIEDCKNIIREITPNIQHVLIEANRCADKMAWLGKTQHEKLVKVLVPTMELVDDLTANLEG